MSEPTFEPINEPTPSPAPSKPRLDSKGIAILIVTAILSLAFLIPGFILATGKGGNSAKPLSLGSDYSNSGESYEYYEYEFEPTSSGYYYINLNGATLSSVESEYGSTVSYQSESTSLYDHTYKIYLTSYTTYTFKVYATDSYTTVQVDDKHIQTLSLGSERSNSTYRYEYYYYTFEPTSSGNYYIFLDGATLSNVESEYGSTVSYQSESSSSYDYAYKVYLSSYTTYTIKVYTNSSYTTVKVDN